MREPSSKYSIQWQKAARKHPGEELWKNMAVAASLVICAVALKNGALPPLTGASDVIVSAVTDDTLLDDQLGKLSFVSALFPEATLVFGQQKNEALVFPVRQGEVVHAWSEAEPYLTLHTEHREVYASAAGTVMGIVHGPDEERLVQIMSDTGLTCIYGNLDDVCVAAGDYVQTGDVLGILQDGNACILEVHQNGIRVNPLDLLSSTQ